MGASIGKYVFFQLDPPPQRAQERIIMETRPGQDGAEFWLDGTKQAFPSRHTSVAMARNQIDANQLHAAYLRMKYTQQRVRRAGFAFEDLYQVLDVTVIEIPPAMGGIPYDGVLLFCEWVLAAVPDTKE